MDRHDINDFGASCGGDDAASAAANRWVRRRCLWIRRLAEDAPGGDGGGGDSRDGDGDGHASADAFVAIDFVVVVVVVVLDLPKEWQILRNVTSSFDGVCIRRCPADG